MPKEIEVLLKPRLDAVTIRPGDKLLVRVSPRITRERADELKAELGEHLPGVEAVIIAAEQIAVYRPDGDG